MPGHYVSPTDDQVGAFVAKETQKRAAEGKSSVGPISQASSDEREALRNVGFSEREIDLLLRRH